MIPESKICNKCNINKSKSEYATRMDKGYLYLKPYCRSCNSAYNRELKRKKAAKNLLDRPQAYCEICNNVLPIKRKIYCSQKCRSKRQANATYENQKTRGKIRKQKMIDKMGGKCSECGYSKCLSALQFHHIDPSTKEFNLDCRRFSNSSQEKLEIEAAKCIILCANCHAKLHWHNAQD